MTFCIITHVAHGYENDEYYAYSPYVKEMNIWLKHVDKVIVVAPKKLSEKTKIHIAYQHPNIEFREVPDFNLTSIKAIFRSLFLLPKLLMIIFKAMKASDHIHLRCPGNMGLLGCFVQLFFPSKPKTAKYAGNWDPKSKQPMSYKLQRFMLSNTFFSRKMQVLVYGKWPDSSKNIKTFFTATYFEKDKEPIENRTLTKIIDFIFVGTLSAGKQPFYAIKLVEWLKNKGWNVRLMLFGDGNERAHLEHYIKKNNLNYFVFFKGNQEQHTVKEAFQKSHFVLLPSKSEGWPKVVAEGMFWGCLPISTAVSCVPNMLQFNERGVLLSLDLEEDVKKIESVLNDVEEYQNKVSKAVNWSRLYTLDYFEAEIEKLLVQ
ncbi:MAG: glycosyltransferase [Flavobacterium sp.]|nr:glycosyltransferase [Flavobacterium sp.]